MCIYYKYQPGLHYKGQEHIFPAGIGGIAKLPKGIVSDEFNNKISKLEQEFMRESIIAAGRQFEGPGKRGSLEIRSATKSKVHVIVDTRDRQSLALGFVMMKRTYEIPHIILNLETGEFNFNFDKTLSDLDPRQMLQEFANRCQHPDKLKVKAIIDNRLPTKTILFGIKEKIEENYDSFFAKNSENGIEWTKELMMTIGNSLLKSNGEVYSKTYIPQSKLQFKFDIEYFRIYGKIAFNFLTYLKGKDYAMHTKFDDFRNWIINGGENHFANLDPGPGFFNAVPHKVQPLVHYIMLTKVEDKLVASVSFYGSLKVLIILSQDFNDPFQVEGFICDWENHREYRLAEYVYESNRKIPEQ